jgi:hypothetical protein
LRRHCGGAGEGPCGAGQLPVARHRWPARTGPPPMAGYGHARSGREEPHTRHPHREQTAVCLHFAVEELLRDKEIVTRRSCDPACQACHWLGLWRLGLRRRAGRRAHRLGLRWPVAKAKQELYAWVARANKDDGPRRPRNAMPSSPRSQGRSASGRVPPTDCRGICNPNCPGGQGSMHLAERSGRPACRQTCKGASPRPRPCRTSEVKSASPRPFRTSEVKRPSPQSPQVPLPPAAPAPRVN